VLHSASKTRTGASLDFSDLCVLGDLLRTAERLTASRARVKSDPFMEELINVKAIAAEIEVDESDSD